MAFVAKFTDSHVLVNIYIPLECLLLYQGDRVPPNTLQPKGKKKKSVNKKHHPSSQFSTTNAKPNFYSPSCLQYPCGEASFEFSRHTFQEKTSSNVKQKLGKPTEVMINIARHPAKSLN